MTTATATVIDSTQPTEDFGNRLLWMMNDAALTFMLSIGHRTGLFDQMALMPPATSEEIAKATGLNERYVREWLAAMVTGRVINYDSGEGTYTLPNEHAALLTRESGSDNIAATMQWFAVLASVEDGVVDSFRNGGGVEYCRFHRFHEVMAAESAQTVVAGLTDHILPLAPGLADRLKQGIDVLDIGCGSGRAMCHLAEAFPASRFTGYDLCDDAIAAGQRLVDRCELKNVTFKKQDVTVLEEVDHYDLITAFDAIHDQREPDVVLRNIHQALKPGGTFLMQDIASSSYLEKNMNHVLGTFLYTISTMHCMTVSLAQGGKGLGTCWGEELAVEMLLEAGFVGMQVRQLPHDIMNNYYISTK